MSNLQRLIYLLWGSFLISIMGSSLIKEPGSFELREVALLGFGIFYFGAALAPWREE